ncbi:MAG: hypothetical protein ACREN2_08525 [Candidatus Dormibacteria bacterium]
MAAAITGTRLIWLVIALLAVATHALGTSLFDGLRISLSHWDAISYLQIAEHGYATHLDYRDAFLPGFPLLIRGVQLVAQDEVLAAWLVCLVAESAGLYFLYRMVEAERDRGSAAFCVWFIALFPTAVFFIAPFTEAPFMAAAAASLYYARQGRSTRAALAAAVAVAFRLTGLALLPALLIEALRPGRRTWQRFLWLAVIPLPLVLYCAYMRLHTGDALALFDAQNTASFSHSLAAPWDGFSATWRTMANATDGDTRSIFAREIAFGLLGLVAAVAMWVSSRVPRSWALYCTVAWLMTASLSFWRSEPRYVLALFPAAVVIADVTAHARVRRGVVLAASAVLMCLATWLFATGEWVG